MIKRLFRSVKIRYARSSNKRYCAYLRSKGVKIGDNVHFDPKTTILDVTRPSLVSIGSNCYMNSHFSILTHDFVSGVFRNKYHDFIPSSGKVTIGDNVGFGVNCIVLKGVEIGDNVFIAAGSLVNKDIPANSIAGGVPCKVICSLDEYYKRRKEEALKEAFDYAKSIVERFGRKPLLSDFNEEFVFFVDKSNINDYPELPIKEQLQEAYREWLDTHKAPFSSFEDFVNAAIR